MTYYMKGFRAAQARYDAMEHPDFYADDPPDCIECDGAVTEERECEMCGGTGKMPESEPDYD